MNKNTKPKTLIWFHPCFVLFLNVFVAWIIWKLLGACEAKNYNSLRLMLESSTSWTTVMEKGSGKIVHIISQCSGVDMNEDNSLTLVRTKL
jgi:membrane-bound acyltransferase YfiQ involved in biofilm formation